MRDDSWRKGVAATGERVRGDSRVSKPKSDCRLMAPRSAILGVEWPRVGFGILNSGLVTGDLVLGILFTGVICSLIFKSPDSPRDGISLKCAVLGLVLAILFVLVPPLSLLALFSLFCWLSLKSKTSLLSISFSTPLSSSLCRSHTCRLSAPSSTRTMSTEPLVCSPSLWALCCE